MFGNKLFSLKPLELVGIDAERTPVTFYWILLLNDVMNDAPPSYSLLNSNTHGSQKRSLFANKVVVALPQLVQGMATRFMKCNDDLTQGVTRRCRLSLLTNSALVYRVQMRGEGGIAGSQPMSSAVHITWHGAQINFGDLSLDITSSSSNI